MDHTLASMPPLQGRTLVLVDTSGSMGAGFSRNGGISRWEAAAVFGSALALRAENADLYEWGSGFRRIEFTRGDSVLTTAGKLGGQGGTDLRNAIQGTYRRGYHDRIVILTDEQSHSTWAGGIDQGTNVHVWNLAGYRFGAVPGLPRYYVWGGLSDQCFTLMQHVEAGGDAAWPWEAPAA